MTATGQQLATSSANSEEQEKQLPAKTMASSISPSACAQFTARSDARSPWDRKTWPRAPKRSGRAWKKKGTSLCLFCGGEVDLTACSLVCANRP